MEINEALPEYKRYTYADYCTWDDDVRRELIDGMPHAMSARMPPAIGAMSAAELDAELQKGYDDICAGRLHDFDDVVAEMQKDYNA